MRDVRWDGQGVAGPALFVLHLAWGGQEWRLLSRNQGGLHRAARVASSGLKEDEFIRWQSGEEGS